MNNHSRGYIAAAKAAAQTEHGIYAASNSALQTAIAFNTRNRRPALVNFSISTHIGQYRARHAD